MTDRERHQLRGPVSSVCIEWASSDPKTADWEPPKHGPTFSFDRDGREEGRVRDKDATITTFDAQGLRTTVSPFGPRIPRQRGLEYGICMDSSVKFDVLAHYDRNDRPVEIVYRNSEQKALHRILIEYDDHGRIAHERVLYGEVFGGALGTSCQSSDQIELSPEQLERLVNELQIMSPDGVFASVDYEYDTRGRVTQLFDRMPPCWEHHRSFTYDERDNVIEEGYESTSRDASVDEHGQLMTSNENRDESWTRYEYRYDVRGNWIEKVTFGRVALDQEFHRSNIERRRITYYDAPDT